MQAVELRFSCIYPSIKVYHGVLNVKKKTFFYISYPSDTIKVKDQEAQNHYLPDQRKLKGGLMDTSQAFFIVK